MPSLKQLTCRVEIGPKDIQLKEYGTAYGDGVVFTYVSVPSQSQTFSIHLASHGYIAPGLAMFVFIDGVPQCNRNRRGLVIPDEKTESSLFEVDFRVRQKEEKFDDKSFIGREWTFQDLKTTTSDGTPKLSHDILHSIGTIEVVILRCRDNETGKKVSTRAAIDVARGMNLDGANHERAVGEIILPFGLDGATDGYPTSPPTDVRYGIWSEAEAVKRGSKVGLTEGKDDSGDDRGRHPLSGLVKAFEKQGYNGYQAPNDHRHQSAIPVRPWAFNPYMPPPGSYVPYVPPNYPPALAEAYAQGFYNPTNAAAPVSELRPNSAKANSKASSRKAGGSKVGDNSGDWPGNTNNANDETNKDDSGGNGDGDKTADDPWGVNQDGQAADSGDTWDTTNQDGQNDGGWDTTKNDENQNNNGGWDNNGRGGGANNGKDDEKNKSKTRREKSKSRAKPEPRTGNDPLPALTDPDKPYVKPYWSKWNHKPFPAGNGKSARDVYVVPEEPLLVIPEKVAEKHDIKHQVHAGKGKMYQHSTATPKYIDSMAAPYAVFVFKYRAKETLEKMFADTDIQDAREPFRDRIKDMTREEVIEQLVKAKKRAGYSTDSDLSSDSSSSSSSENRDKKTVISKRSDAKEKAKKDENKTTKHDKARGRSKTRSKSTSGGGDDPDWGVGKAGGGGPGESWEATVAKAPTGGW